MKVLFVCSGNKSNEPGVVVSNQAQSLQAEGIGIDYFLIGQKGIKGYIKHISLLRQYLKENPYDVVHAHGISSIVATLARAKPLVVSLLGSELNESKLLRKGLRFFAKSKWDHTIVKSEDMVKKLGIKNHRSLSVLPNGVNAEVYKPISEAEENDKFNISKSSKQRVLWLADPSRKSKNFPLALKAIKSLDESKVELLQVHNIPAEQVPYYINSSDVVLLTSLWEGSPNIVKEAMACNKPIVATKVGDVEWLFGNKPGHFITSFEPQDVADKIAEALVFAEQYGQTNGRNRLIELQLDSQTIAQRIIEVYKEVAKL